MSQRKAFLLRVTPELYATLERWAAEELRSVNGQIEYLLTQAARQSGRMRAGAGGAGLAAPPRDETDDADDADETPGSAPDATGIP